MKSKKMVPCGNPTCDQRRVHWDRQDEMRPRRMVPVKEDYMGKTFCSITCACEAGYFDVKSGWIKNPKEG